MRLYKTVAEYAKLEAIASGSTELDVLQKMVKLSGFSLERAHTQPILPHVRQNNLRFLGLRFINKFKPEHIAQMAVSTHAANFYLSVATRTSPAILRLDRPLCTDHNP